MSFVSDIVRALNAKKKIYQLLWSTVNYVQVFDVVSDQKILYKLTVY